MQGGLAHEIFACMLTPISRKTIFDRFVKRNLSLINYKSHFLYFYNIFNIKSSPLERRMWSQKIHKWDHIMKDDNLEEDKNECLRVDERKFGEYECP